MKILVTIVVVALLLTLAVGCAVEPGIHADNLIWSVVKSPVTGRYYEVAKPVTGGGSRYIMSEVTEKEYLEYIAHGK